MIWHAILLRTVDMRGLKMTLSWGWLMMDIGLWLIAIGVFIGAMAGLLWCMAKLIEISERK
jgi:hypothetical protein